MVVIDVADRTQPKLITHRNWSPPFGGGNTIACRCPTAIC
jgi:hypothetical protein